MRAWLSSIVWRIVAVFRGDRHDRDLNEDIQTHLQLLADEFVTRGMSQEEAQRQARLRFGSIDAAVEYHRDARSMRWIERTANELRWAWRGVRSRGWQAVLVVLLLGVSLGANAILFSAADAFVFQRFPYEEPDRLVVLEHESSFGPSYSFTAPAILEWRRHPELFSAVHAREVAGLLYITIGDTTEGIGAAMLTPGFAEMLGGVPKWGRPLSESDAAAGAMPVVVIAEDLATRMYGDPAVAVGKSLSTRNLPVAVVGVMPASFRYPSGRERVWHPLRLDPAVRNRGYETVAKLARGVTLEQAASRVAELAEPIDRAHGSLAKRRPVTLRTLGDSRANGRYTDIFRVLWAAALCLLAIACANVASLELAPALRRGRLMGVKAALGAGRAALVRGQFFESGILLALGAASSVLFTFAGLRALTAAIPATMAGELTNPIDFDRRGVLFLLAAVAATWILTAAPAAWRASRTRLLDALNDEARAGSVSRPTRFLRQILVVGQVAATVLLLATSILYTRTYAARMGLDKGLDSRGVASVRVIPAHDAPLEGAPLAEAVRETLAAHPQVKSVALTQNIFPATGGSIGGRLSINGGEPVAEITAHGHGVTPGYFNTLGIRLIEGSFLTSTSAPSDVVLDERFAQRFWPGTSPIGSRFKVGSAGYGRVNEFRVVGVAGHVRPDRLQAEGGRDLFVFYYPMIQGRTTATAVIKVDADDALTSVAAALRARAPRCIVSVVPIAELYARLEGDRRVAAAATTGMGLLALIVATLGIYAVMAFIVSGRKREIGVRLALGASTGDVRRSIFRESLTFVVAGSVIGVAAALAVARYIESQLFGVSPTDAGTYVVVVAVSMVMYVAATWHPARQAARVDPAITLKSQ